MAFVVALEEHGRFQHRLLQQATFGAQLIGGDGFMLQSEGDIQDADIGAHVAARGKG